jgi:hypothetical protein
LKRFSTTPSVVLQRRISSATGAKQHDAHNDNQHNARTTSGKLKLQARKNLSPTATCCDVLGPKVGLFAGNSCRKLGVGET